MTLAFDPQNAPAPTDDPSDRDLIDLGDEAWLAAYDAFSEIRRTNEKVANMAILMSEFIGGDVTRFAQFKRFLAERTPAAEIPGEF